MRETLLICPTLTCKSKALIPGQIQTPRRQLNVWAVASLQWIFLCDLYRKMPFGRVVKSWEQRGKEWCEVLGVVEVCFLRRKSFSLSLCVCAQALLVTLGSTVIIYSTQTLKWAWQADSFLQQSNSQNFQVYALVWQNISAKIRISCWVSCLFCPHNSLLPSIIHHSETILGRESNKGDESAGDLRTLFYQRKGGSFSDCWLFQVLAWPIFLQRRIFPS